MKLNIERIEVPMKLTIARIDLGNETFKLEARAVINGAEHGLDAGPYPLSSGTNWAHEEKLVGMLWRSFALTAANAKTSSPKTPQPDE